MSKINNILKLEDEVAIIEAIGEIIWQKKEETEEFSDLTDAEKVFVHSNAKVGDQIMIVDGNITMKKLKD